MRAFRVGIPFFLTILSSLAVCEDKIAVIILQAPLPTDSVQYCRGVIETKYEVVRNLKINGRSEVRAEPVRNDSHQQPITRQEYEHAKSVNIKDLAQLEIRDGVLYGLSSSNETLLLFPQDKKPEKNSPIPLLELFKVSVDGQSAQPKSKEKQNLDLQNIWKIFNLGGNDKPESALFLHVAQENKAAFWKGYLKDVSEYKLTEAVAGLRDTLSQCVNDSLARFANGSYAALKDAEAEALESKGVEDSSATQALMARVEAEKKNLVDLIAQASNLTQEGKWDDALTALDPLKKYLGQLRELDSAFTLANDGSYELHLHVAKDNLHRNKPAEALKEYEVALSRKPDSSEAQSGRKEALITKTVADSRRLRQLKKPGNAREQILSVLATEKPLSDDMKLAAELKLASCEFSAQLLSDAQKLVLSPTKNLRPILTEVIETAFVEAHEKLKTAEDACTSKTAVTLLDRVTISLVGFHLEHSRRAKGRGLFALALLHSQTALYYSPDNADANALKEQMDKTVHDRVRVKVGVKLRDISPDHSCGQEASALRQMVESQIASSIYDLLEPDQTETFYRTPQSQRPPNYALILGDVSSCSVQRTVQEQPIQSKYRVSNPAYSDIKNAEQNAEQQYRNCRSTYGDANCGPAQQNFEAIRDQRRNTQEWLKYDYTYTVRATTLYGKESVSLQVLSSSNPNSVGPLQEEIRDQCVEEVGVRDDDDARSGVVGMISNAVTNVLAARHAGQNHCPLSEDEQYRSNLQHNIQQRLPLAIPFPLARVANHYLKHARQVNDRDVALDNYVTALIATSSVQSPEFKEAIQGIKSQSPTLRLEALVAPQKKLSENLKDIGAVRETSTPTAHATDIANSNPKSPTNLSFHNNGMPIILNQGPVTPKLKAEMPSSDFRVSAAIRLR